MEPGFNDGMTDELLIRFLHREADEEERRRVSQWLMQEEHRQYFEQLRFLQQQSKKRSVRMPVDIDGEWRIFQTRIAEEDILPVRPEVRKFRPSAVAAAVFLILGGLIAFLVYNNGDRVPVVVKAGDRVLYDTLPDGSVLTLNKGAIVTYRHDFTKNRVLTLTGESFFEISPDKSRPFIITTSGASIKVTGTSFNVRTHSDYTEVVVETGKVELRNKQKAISLLPGEKGIAVPGDSTLIREAHPGQLYNYYRSNMFICKGTRLDELATTLSTAYGRRIIIPDPAKREIRITATFRKASFDEVLSLICNTLQLKAERQDGQVILR